MQNTPKLDAEIITKWHEAAEAGSDELLDFAEGLNINEFTDEDGERVIYFEDGQSYTAHGYRMGENDGEAERAIIEELEACGVEFGDRLDYLRRELRAERISWGELAELAGYRAEILRRGDAELAEAAGITEADFMTAAK